MSKLLRSILPLVDTVNEKISLTCPKCHTVSEPATSGVLMVLGWRRLRYHLANGPLTHPICKACRKKVTE